MALRIRPLAGFTFPLRPRMLDFSHRSFFREHFSLFSDLRLKQVRPLTFFTLWWLPFFHFFAKIIFRHHFRSSVIYDWNKWGHWRFSHSDDYHFFAKIIFRHHFSLFSDLRLKQVRPLTFFTLWWLPISRQERFSTPFFTLQWFTTQVSEDIDFLTLS